MSMDGAISRAGEGFLLEFDEVYPTDPDDLWEAVTTADRLGRWMAPYRGDLRLGGRWEAIGSDGEPWCVGEVTACDPPRSFETTWHAREEQPTLLRVELHPEGDGTRLRLRHEGVRSIYYGAGWHTYLELLVRHLGDPAPSIVDGEAWDRRFAELSGAYEERFRALRA
ncbi:hypothetical protein ARHIZOSPH14_24700 [Agromyces rhizosphaerae]|uniref:Activator of Hsp90 ATPase homologue 1/2-like C-terminal domain-containing protein n=1 Tax=Agromyces rhizosphaerae TaxID=88374 RepID=A0A9W6CTJ6_9MICO|nr:SRPBCC family protein [Agromyces rhizosphaerae]GLI28228.1 hypothetical protein ARHIZOSPH14_24700 [Agromyces rhizosphaerae]